MPRHNLGSSQIANRKNRIRNANNNQGWKNAAHKPPSTVASSENDAVQLLRGSGVVLIMARLPALVACAPNAKVPPTSAATVVQAGSMWPIAATARIAPAGI